MNYFVNESIFTNNGGIEFSAVKRVKLFREHGVSAKVLTRFYDAELERDIGYAGLSRDEVLSMYDYFQEITDVPKHEKHVRDIEAVDKTFYHIEGLNWDEALIRYGGLKGTVVGRMHVSATTYGIISAIDYLDPMGEIVAKDIWDSRGFKSSTQYYHPDGSMGTQVFFDSKGKSKLEMTRMAVNGTVQPTLFKLLDYKGRILCFNTEEELFIFFMNELAAEAPSVFINDRLSQTYAVAQVQGAIGKWLYLHQHHLAGGNDGHMGDYLNNLIQQYGTNYDGLIVATSRQAKDLESFHLPVRQIISVPDTFSEEVEAVGHTLATRDKNKIIMLGRLAREHNPIEAVKVLALVRQKLPDVTLEIWGYPSPESLKKEIFDQPDGEAQADHVIFRNYQGYRNNGVLPTNLLQTALLINTASFEGFGMHILEAMSYGIPIVAYDINYGIRDQVGNGRNGLLVPFGASQRMADTIVSLLTDESKWSAMSRVATKEAAKFGSPNTWQRWLEAQGHVENLFIK